MRDPESRLLWNGITRNPFIWGALLLCSLLLLGATFLPALSDTLKIVDPGPKGWLVVLMMSLVPLVSGQLYLIITGRIDQAKR